MDKHFKIALPYTNDPQTNSEYFMYFTKSWLDILFLSLTNFLCLIFYSQNLNNNPLHEIDSLQKSLQVILNFKI